ncbi:MAG: hypothetical protein M3Q69_15825, partial [Acidobacteriota bacterium]|nr:hypothetical protein [Acidobacteriota bacterium]
MRRFLFLVTLAVFAMRCSHQHCSDQAPDVALDVQQAAFREKKMHGVTRDFRVFSRGNGPAVVIFHELPGLSPATFRLAHRVSEAGFT